MRLSEAFSIVADISNDLRTLPVIETVAIQDVLVPHAEVLKDLSACKDAGISPICFGLIPFTNDVSVADEADLAREAVPFGSTKLIRMHLEGKLPKGWKVFYDEHAFDQRHWGTLLGSLALNGDATHHLYGNIKDWRCGGRTFIKPANDLKAFAGLIVEEGETLAERIAQQTTDMHLTGETPVILAEIQEINSEFRCFVNGDDHWSTILGMSCYREDGKPNARTPTDSERIRLMDAIVDTKYAPAPYYVVDFAFMADGSTKVVEYNCINCSGRYAIDRGKLFKAMMDA